MTQRINTKYACFTNTVWFIIINMSELQKIFVKGDDLDKKLLAEILSPFLTVDAETKKIYFTENGYNQTTEKKIILFLLAHKAMFVEGITNSEGLLPASLISSLGLKRGTVHPLLKKMREKGLAMAVNGEYVIPNHHLYRIKKLLMKSERV